MFDPLIIDPLIVLRKTFFQKLKLFKFSYQEYENVFSQKGDNITTEKYNNVIYLQCN